jgi:hypothetical protein
MRSSRLLAVLLCLAPLALAAAAAPPEAPAAELRFAWPAGSRATVTERVLKRGKRAVTRYDATLRARAGGGYELKLDGFRFLEIEGRDVSKGPIPEELKAATAMNGALPTLVLSADGRVTDITGFEEAMRLALQAVPEEKGQREQVRAALAQPAMAQMMKQRAGEFWNAWAGAWVGMDLKAGEERSATVPMQLATGPVDSAVTVRHLGADAAGAGAVRLELKTVLEGEPFRKAMAGMLGQMVRSAPAKGSGTPPDFDAQLKSARKVSTLDVVTDPTTLRPYRASTTEVTQLAIQGEPREERVEHEYTFAWAKAPAKGR